MFPVKKKRKLYLEDKKEQPTNNLLQNDNKEEHVDINWYDVIVYIASYLFKFENYFKLCQLNKYFYVNLLDSNNYCFKNALQNMYISLKIATANYERELSGCVFKKMELDQCVAITGLTVDDETEMMDYKAQFKFVREVVIEDFIHSYVHFLCVLISKGLFPSLERVIIIDREYKNYEGDLQYWIKLGVYLTAFIEEIENVYDELNNLEAIEEYDEDSDEFEE
ncbi:hypothetical protein ABK040_013685 [Willaertia magna]